MVKKNIFKTAGLFFCILIAASIFSSIVCALGIGSLPGQRIINFEPNKKVVLSYFILSADTDVKVYVAGDLAEDIKVTKEVIRARDSDTSFNVIIDFPEKIEPPGIHKMSVVADQVDATKGGTLGTKVNVRVNFDIFVPYPGKYVELSVSAPNVDINETVNIYYKLSNKGKETISRLYADIYVFNATNNSITGYKTESISLAPQTSYENSVLLNTTGLSSGEYRIVMQSEYPGKNKSSAAFRIGSQKVLLMDYTKDFYTGTINKFEIGLINDWSVLTGNIYAEILMDGKSFKTPVITLAPWQYSKAEGYLDANGISEGIKNAAIIVYYGENKDSSPVELLFKNKIVEQPAKISLAMLAEANTTVILIAALIVLIIITLALILKVYGSGSSNKSAKQQEALRQKQEAALKIVPPPDIALTDEIRKTIPRKARKNKKGSRVKER